MSPAKKQNPKPTGRNYIKKNPDKIYHHDRILQYSYPQGKFLREWNSISQISIETDFDPGNIHRACMGIYNHAYRFVWKRINDCLDENGKIKLIIDTNTKKIPTDRGKTLKEWWRKKKEQDALLGIVKQPKTKPIKPNKRPATPGNIKAVQIMVERKIWHKQQRELLKKQKEKEKENGNGNNSPEQS